MVDDEPLVFHTGPRRMFPQVSEAVAKAAATETVALHRLPDTWRFASTERSYYEKCVTASHSRTTATAAGPLA